MNDAARLVAIMISSMLLTAFSRSVSTQKYAINVRRKLDLPSFCVAFTHAGILTERTQPLCRVILVQKTRLQLPDVKLLLTHRKQHGMSSAVTMWPCGSAAPCSRLG